jgi:hypothetical protein
MDFRSRLTSSARPLSSLRFCSSRCFTRPLGLNPSGALFEKGRNRSGSHDVVHKHGTTTSRQECPGMPPFSLPSGRGFLGVGCTLVRKHGLPVGKNARECLRFPFPAAMASWESGVRLLLCHFHLGIALMLASDASVSSSACCLAKVGPKDPFATLEGFASVLEACTALRKSFANVR